MAYPLNVDDVKIIGKDLLAITGKVTIDGASAVSAQVPTVAQGAPFTASKPAGTGIYRITLNNFVFNEVFFSDATLFQAAGTLDRDILPVADNTNSQNFVTSCDFQVKKTSDGSAVDPVSTQIRFVIIGKCSSLRP